MKMSVRKAILFYTLLPILVIFIIFAVENIYETSQEVHRRIEGHMADLAYSYASLFNEMLTSYAGIAKMTAQFIETDPNLKEADIYQLLRQQVENNHTIYGAWVAYAPYQFDPNRQFVAPYVFRHAKKASLNKILALTITPLTSGNFGKKP